MPSTVLTEIKQQLKLHKPKLILLASKEPPTDLLSYLKTLDCHLEQVSSNEYVNTFTHKTNSQFNQNQTFTIVINFLEHIEKDTAIRQIAMWRNFYSSKIWIGISSQTANWQFQDFIALGFKRMQPALLFKDDASDINLSNDKNLNSTPSENQGVSLINTYGYDLGLYNLKRNWNNPRYWANPEHWNKRW